MRPSTASGWSGAVGMPPPAAGSTNKKLLHIVRHAQGYHNVDPQVMRSPAGIDAQLTDEGRRQCAALADTVASTHGIHPEIIVSSPLSRTLETAALSFGAYLKEGTPMVALEAVRETVNFCCDARRPLSTNVAAIEQMGVRVDTSGCLQDHDELWAQYERELGTQEQYTGHRESADLSALAMRAREAFAWLGARPEREIVLVTHSAFLWNTLNMARLGRKQGVSAIVDYGGDRELEGWLAARFENAEMKSVVCEFL